MLCFIVRVIHITLYLICTVKMYSVDLDTGREEVQTYSTLVVQFNYLTLGVVHILRNQLRGGGGGFRMITLV